MANTATQPTDVDMIDAKTHVLAIGDWHHREFAKPAATLSGSCVWSQVATIDQACGLLSNCLQPPELIFLAQSLPGQIRQQDVDRLQQQVPLARLVLVAGTWCEGELRTGTPPSGVIRLYWYELATWWQAAIRRQNAGLCPLWSLPLDHAQAGRWSSELLRSPPIGAISSVLIDAADYSVYETLSDALATYTIQSHWNGRDIIAPIPIKAAPTTAGIWDGGQLSSRELARLTHFCQQTNGLILALLDFPRVEHIKQTRAAGAAAVFAKPYIVEELVAAITKQHVTELRP